jgi:TRAP-type C4-dicarboxylate transport system permease small subunit
MERARLLFWRVVSNVALVCFLAMLAVMVLQVLFRDALGVAASWTDEATRYLFIWAIFLGSAVAQRTGEHVRIRLVIDRLPAWLQRVGNVATDLFCALILVVLLVGSAKMMYTTYGILASTMAISFTWVYLALALGVGIMLALILRDVVTACRPCRSRAKGAGR